MLLVKLPLTEPSVVLLSEVVGVEVVDQTKPLTVTVAPPLYVMLPPLVAVVAPIELAVVVTARVATDAAVLTEISGPYFGPTLLVA